LPTKRATIYRRLADAIAPANAWRLCDFCRTKRRNAKGAQSQGFCGNFDHPCLATFGALR
jgi:hypothetical protein